MSTMTIVAVVLIIIGVIALAYGGLVSRLKKRQPRLDLWSSRRKTPAGSPCRRSWVWCR